MDLGGSATALAKLAAEHLRDLGIGIVETAG
jgi:hypothetical protein